LGKAYRNLLALLCNTHAVVDKIDVVGEESVSGVLGNNTEGDEESQSVSVALGPHEVQVAAGLLVFKFESQGLLDFTELECNCRVLPITVGVVMGKDSLGLLITLLGDEPTWRFWDPVDECELDNSWQALEKGESSPRPVVGDGGGSPGDPGND
jgi:hypothetical protein